MKNIIDFIKNRLKEIENKIDGFSYIYGVDEFTSTHTVKVSNFNELKKNDEFVKMRYFILKDFNREFCENMMFIDAAKKHELDEVFYNSELQSDFTFEGFSQQFLEQLSKEYTTPIQQDFYQEVGESNYALAA